MDTPRITPQIPGLVGQPPSLDFRPLTAAAEGTRNASVRMPSPEIKTLVRSYSRAGRDGKKNSVKAHSRRR